MQDNSRNASGTNLKTKKDNQIAKNNNKSIRRPKNLRFNSNKPPKTYNDNFKNISDSKTC